MKGLRLTMMFGKRLVVTIMLVGVPCLIYITQRDICPYQDWHAISNLPLSERMRIPSSHYIDLHPHHVTTKSRSNKGRKLILLWTNYHAIPSWLKTDVFRGCSVSTCETTDDKKRLEESDVLLFHPRNILNTPMPESRLSHQRWTIFTLEPPYFNAINMAEFGGVFNWTVTYRRDSDFVHSYGKFLPRTGSDISDDGSYENVLKHVKMKTKLVAARISNCKAKTKRLEYVRELQNYLTPNVDFYGNCGDITCPRISKCDNLMNDYKFYLSFENGLCRDYVTEKFWNTLSIWHSVPIVMGGAGPEDYKLVAPPRSYINTADFTSVGDLADYLTLLDRNESLYMQYHQWRKYFFVPRTTYYDHTWTAFTANKAWCDMCAALHDTSLPSQTYRDLSGWYLRDNCEYNDEHIFCPDWNVCCAKNPKTGRIAQL